MPETTVELSALSRSFGNRTIIRDISLSMSGGRVYGLVGLNGAGKTTLLRIILGLLKADSGTCRVLGCDPWKHDFALYRRMGAVLEHNGFCPNLTVTRNLTFFANARGIRTPETEEYMDTYWHDTPVYKRREAVKFLSRGEKMQCALCRAFLGWPKVMILDEPVVALDIKAYDHFCSLVRKAAASASTVIISSHQMDAIDDLCDTVYLLENGSISIMEKERKKQAAWNIKAGNNPEFGTIMESLGAQDVIHENGIWYLSVESDKPIPEIVKKMVRLGAEITEVRKCDNGLRESLIGHFRDTGKSRQGEGR